jgi:hypothetical protein
VSGAFGVKEDNIEPLPIHFSLNVAWLGKGPCGDQAGLQGATTYPQNTIVGKAIITE